VTDDVSLPFASSAGSETTITYTQPQMRRARELLARLYSTRRAVRFYPMEHPAVEQGVDSLLQTLGAFFQEGVDVQLSFHDGEVMLGEQLLVGESVHFDQLARELSTAGIGVVEFRRGIDAGELVRALAVLGSDSETVERAGGVAALVSNASLRHVVIGQLKTVDHVASDDDEPEIAAREAYDGALGLIREIGRLVRSNRAIGDGRVKGVVRSLVDNVLHNRPATIQLAGLKSHDQYTFYHSANVSILSIALGSLVTTDYRFLSSLGVGALLHDLGKLAVDHEILNKPGVLTPEEWAVVRRHPVNGAQMAADMPGVDRSAIVTILEHHMRFDGSGYPTRTPVRAQHLASRIVAIADAYDAMTSRRSYSAARVHDDAMSLLAASAGTSLDPGLVRLFIGLMGVYPPRSVVKLSGGEVAIVVQPSASDPLRPLVRVVAEADGRLVDARDLDLGSANGIHIAECLDPRLLNITVEDYV
jgi:HD-GYP domain-containing protein (c-di-GMP phosphodiesterase class II)